MSNRFSWFKTFCYLIELVGNQSQMAIPAQVSEFLSKTAAGGGEMENASEPPVHIWTGLSCCEVLTYVCPDKSAV